MTSREIRIPYLHRRHQRVEELYFFKKNRKNANLTSFNFRWPVHRCSRRGARSVRGLETTWSVNMETPCSTRYQFGQKWV